MKLDELANTIIRIKKNIMSLNLKAKIERSMFIEYNSLGINY